MRRVLSRSLLGSLGAVSGATVYKSLWQPIDSFEQYMIQLTFTGSPTANISLLISADPVTHNFVPIDNNQPVNYDYASGSTLAASSVSVGPSGSLIVTYEVTTSSANWVAVEWNNASGSGVVTSINFVGKGKN